MKLEKKGLEVKQRVEEGDREEVMEKKRSSMK